MTFRWMGIVMATAAMLVLSYGSSLANAKASASLTVTYSREQDEQHATDLHFMVHLADWDGDGEWEGEGSETGYWMIDWDITTSAGGTVTLLQLANPETYNTYALDADVTGIDLPNGTSVTITAGLTLNSWNSVIIDDVRFTIPGEVPGAPGSGFAYDPSGVSSGPHTTGFTMYNPSSDPDEWYRIEWLEFFVRDAWLDPDAQWSEFGGGPGSGFQTVMGPIYLMPGQSLPVELSVPDSGGAASFLYTAGEISYSMPGCPSCQAELRFGHEEDMPVAVDESTWGAVKALYE